MTQVFDYIDRYNISFIDKEFNEIDNLIFSRFVYMIFDGILSFDEKLTISDAYEKYTDINPNFHDKVTLKLFEKMASSNRYKDLIIGNYLSITSDSLEKQFAAITFYLPDSSVYISFRGTDSSFIGIKEDFNMTYMSHIASQIDSVKYLENVVSNNNYKIMLGGHSKGGNLAMYASIFCKEKYRKRIIAIYNNDGPGFFDEVIENPKYQEILDRTYTYVPESSIIGMLLYHKEKVIVVKSKKSLIMQHDLFSWEIDDDKFVRACSVNKKSKYIDDVMSSLLLMPDYEKEKFFNILYQIIAVSGAKTVRELSNQKVKSAKEILSNYKRLNEEEKETFIKVWKEIIKVARLNIKNYLPKRKKD